MFLQVVEAALLSRINRLEHRIMDIEPRVSVFFYINYPCLYLEGYQIADIFSLSSRPRELWKVFFLVLCVMAPVYFNAFISHISG